MPVTGCGGLYGCEMVRITQLLDYRLIDDGEVVSPLRWLQLYSIDTLFFCFWF
jgi:hypothetical protein